MDDVIVYTAGGTATATLQELILKLQVDMPVFCDDDIVGTVRQIVARLYDEIETLQGHLAAGYGLGDQEPAETHR
jgi:hypothetical protein